MQQPVEHAAATMGSSKILPHEPTPRFVVMQMLPFRYLCGDDLEQRSGRLDAKGRYPTSSTMSSLGPAKNRMVVAHRPSSAAR